jgi:hypothetical protein
MGGSGAACPTVAGTTKSAARRRRRRKLSCSIAKSEAHRAGAPLKALLLGAPRIHGELLKLGFVVAQSSVAKIHGQGKRWSRPVSAGVPSCATIFRISRPWICSWSRPSGNAGRFSNGPSRIWSEADGRADVPVGGVGERKQIMRDFYAQCLGRLKLMTNSNLVGCLTGSAVHSRSPTCGAAACIAHDR